MEEGKGGTMKNDLWETILIVFEKMENLCAHLKPIDAALPEVEQGGGAPPETPSIGSANGEDTCYDLIAIRAEIRKELDFIRVKLAEQLTERDCYLVIFPIVAYFDEYVQISYLDENQMSWPPLQKELFEIDDAGELFYETVDDILRKPQTVPFVYEVFYFCLNKGFKGRYVDNPVKIQEYLKKLEAKIPVEVPVGDQPAVEPSERMKSVSSPAWYYAAAAALLIACYFLLRVSANYWDIGS